MTEKEALRKLIAELDTLNAIITDGSLDYGDLHRRVCEMAAIAKEALKVTELTMAEAWAIIREEARLVQENIHRNGEYRLRMTIGRYRKLRTALKVTEHTVCGCGAQGRVVTRSGERLCFECADGLAESEEKQ